MPAMAAPAQPQFSEPAPRAFAPVAPAAPAEPVLQMHESTPAAPPEAPQASSPLLGGLDPDDRLSISSDADDPLDIPAFLRRQAN
jgi:cell division protein FtsZ